jgi:hypothetical protein
MTAYYNTDLWEQQQTELEDEILETMEKEVRAAQQAEQWKRQRQERQEQLRLAEEAERAAKRQAALWKSQEEEMANMDSQNRFQRYQETLRH